MKVLLVSSGSGSRGGGELYLTLLASGLSKMGCSVIVAIPDNRIMDELASQFETSIDVVRFPFTPTYERSLRGIGALLDQKQVTALEAFFEDQRPDIIHINQQVAEDGLDLVLAASRGNVPWVSTIHVGRSAASLKAKLGTGRDVVSHSFLKRVGGQFICVSEASCAQLERRFASKQVKLGVVHNGVRSQTDSSLEIARKQSRTDWSAGADTIVIGAVGRIEEQKNPLALVDHVAAANLDKEHKVVWIGDGSLRSELEQHAAAKGVNLHIDGWRTDAATRLSGLDLFVLPSKFEGLPLAILEAMHAGVPVIASHSDGIPEAVEHGVCGWLCQSDSDWRDAIASLANDDSLRNQFASAAIDKARVSFSETSMASGTMKYYQAALTK